MDEDQTMNAARIGVERKEFKLRFAGEGIDMLGWVLVYILTQIALGFPQAWWERSVLRWGARKTLSEDGSTFIFGGNPREIWYWFPLPAILNFLSGRVGDSALGTFLSLSSMIIGMWVSWRVLVWFCQGLRLRGNIGFRFTGRPITYIGLQMLTILSAATIVGWAWVQVYVQKWIYRHMESEHAELRMVGRPIELLGLGLLFFGVPIMLILMLSGLSVSELFTAAQGLATRSHYPEFREIFHGWNIAVLCVWLALTPWMMVWMWRWFIRNTRLVAEETAPVSVPEPAASE